MALSRSGRSTEAVGTVDRQRPLDRRAIDAIRARSDEARNAGAIIVPYFLGSWQRSKDERLHRRGTRRTPRSGRSSSRRRTTTSASTKPSFTGSAASCGCGATRRTRKKQRRASRARARDLTPAGGARAAAPCRRQRGQAAARPRPRCRRRLDRSRHLPLVQGRPRGERPARRSHVPGGVSCSPILTPDAPARPPSLGQRNGLGQEVRFCVAPDGARSTRRSMDAGLHSYGRRRGSPIWSSTGGARSGGTGSRGSPSTTWC